MERHSSLRSKIDKRSEGKREGDIPGEREKGTQRISLGPDIPAFSLSRWEVRELKEQENPQEEINKNKKRLTRGQRQGFVGMGGERGKSPEPKDRL